MMLTLTWLLLAAVSTPLKAARDPEAQANDATCEGTPDAEAKDDTSLLAHKRIKVTSGASEEFDPSAWYRTLPMDFTRANEVMKLSNLSLADANMSFQFFDTDKLHTDMTYQKKGSPGPSTLSGLWWMNQFCKNYTFATGSDYTCYFPAACSELVATVGGGEWLPDQRCYTPVFPGGEKTSLSSKQSHWIYTSSNETSADNSIWQINSGLNVMIVFCLPDGVSEETAEFFQLFVGIKPPNEEMYGLTKALGFLDAPGGYVWVPDSLTKFSMMKRSWGWDRITEIVPGFINHLEAKALEALFSGKLPVYMATTLFAEALKGKFKFHYPLIPLVDSDGNKVEKNFEAFKGYVRELNKEAGVDPATRTGFGTSSSY